MSRDSPDLRTTIAGRVNLLVDFDGPDCAVYAGTPAPLVAYRLRHQIRAAMGAAVPDETDDPLEVIRSAAVLEAGGTAEAERMLTALEVEAVRTARPTPGADKLIVSARATGRTVTIVSNNSARAISDYCIDHGLAPNISYVIGRSQDPTLMKPDPYLVELALAALVCGWIQEPDGVCGQGITAWLNCAPADQLYYLAEQFQDWACDVQYDPARRPWPDCPDHPGTHPLEPETHDDIAVWYCPQTLQVVADIGALDSPCTSDSPRLIQRNVR